MIQERENSQDQVRNTEVLIALNFHYPIERHARAREEGVPLRPYLKRDLP